MVFVSLSVCLSESLYDYRFNSGFEENPENEDKQV